MRCNCCWRSGLSFGGLVVGIRRARRDSRDAARAFSTDEEWVAANRERYRLARLAGLESAACALLDRGQPDKALIAALAVVEGEALRESARRIVMRAHLAQGNTVEAIQEHRRYRRLLHSEFGVEPSPEMDHLPSACYQQP